MNNDWKDALSSLRNSLNEPDQNSEEFLSQEEAEEKPSQKSPLYVITDKKGRNGKVATIIEGFTIPQAEIEVIARKLKQKLGVGGSVREGEILIQGDRKEDVKKFLAELNYKTK